MRILLTGALGLIGRAVVQEANSIHELVQVDVQPDTSASCGHVADVTDRDVMLQLARGCDAIIHLATSHNDAATERTNQDYLRRETLAADNLFHAAERHGIRRVVMASSIMVCWDQHSHYGTHVLDESLPAAPGGYYALNKWLIEQLGHFYARTTGIEYVGLRYGAVQNWPMERLAFSLLSRRMSSADAARATLAAATTADLRDEVFCVGPGSPLNQADSDQAATDPWPVLERHWPGCAKLLRARGLEPSSSDFSPVISSRKLSLMTGWRPRDTFAHWLHLLGWCPAG